MTSGHKDQTDVEGLLALAGPRDAVPADRLARMRVAVHDAWTAEARLRAKRRWAWTFAAAATAAVVVIAAMTWRQPQERGEQVAAKRVVPAQEIVTAPAELRSIRLRNGADIRLDSSSRVSITEDQSLVVLSAGAVYVDSRGAANMPIMRTPGGQVMDIGTRFEIRVIDDRAGTTRVRVRDGRLRMEQSRAIVFEAGAAEELTSHPGRGGIERRHVDPFGAEWAWVARAAPRLDLDGKSLASFLDWIENEGAWTVAFTSPALEQRARSTVLHGSIEGMSTIEALEAILPACGLGHRVNLKTGRVTIVADVLRAQ